MIGHYTEYQNEPLKGGLINFKDLIRAKDEIRQSAFKDSNSQHLASVRE